MNHEHWTYLTHTQIHSSFGIHLQANCLFAHLVNLFGNKTKYYLIDHYSFLNKYTLDARSIEFIHWMRLLWTTFPFNSNCRDLCFSFCFFLSFLSSERSEFFLTLTNCFWFIIRFYFYVPRCNQFNVFLFSLQNWWILCEFWRIWN